MLVYQIDGYFKRLPWVGEKHKVKTLPRFFRLYDKERNQVLKFVCGNMWKPCLKTVAKKAGGAVPILH
jgi:hypothetical protein